MQFTRLMCTFLTLIYLASICRAEDWPRFRGPNGSGVTETIEIPTEWSETKNVRWKVDLPGPGASSPIVLGDRVMLTCYTGYGLSKDEPGEASNLKRHLLCFDKTTGEKMWQADVPSAFDEDEYQGFITEHGYASSTPVTDGDHVFVMFGKTGVAAFDLDGKQLWLTHLGKESDPYKWGGGGSSLVYDDVLIVNASIVGNAIVGLNKADGSVVWKYEDPELTNCWSTPIIVRANDRDELVTCVPGKIMGLDPKTGEELWFADSPIANTTCASVVENDGVVFAMGGRAGDAIGVRCGGEGDVSETHTVWREKLRSGIGTPVVKNGHLFWSSTGIAFCADCDTGQAAYKERLPKPEANGDAEEGGERRRPTGDYASAIAVGDLVFLTTRGGTTHVLKATGEFQPVGQNQIADDEGPFNGTPAVSGDAIYLRSDKSLYCIANG